MSNRFFTIIFSVGTALFASYAHADLSVWLRNKNYANMEYFECGNDNHFCARALAELKRDFAVQQELMKNQIDFFVEKSLCDIRIIEDFTIRYQDQPELFALKGLRTIHVHVCYEGVTVEYDFGTIPEITDASTQQGIMALMLEPYGPLLAHISFALRCGREWTHLYPHATNKKVMLNSDGNYAYMYWDVKRQRYHFICTVMLSLTQQQRSSIEKGVTPY